MKYYFSIQWEIIKRKLFAFGVNPFFAFILFVILFIPFSMYLFYKTEYAPYIFILLAGSLMTKLLNSQRLEFLYTWFNKKEYFLIRSIENIVVGLPFVIYLMYAQKYIFAVLVIILAFVMIFSRKSISLNWSMPTPFAKTPYEFTSGFRSGIGFIILSYFICGMALAVDNFGLVLFSLVFIYIISYFFYSEMESEFYIWVHSDNAAHFLIRKLKTGILLSTLLSIPVLALMFVYFKDKIWITAIVLVMVYLFFALVVFSKYSYYPKAIPVPAALIIGTSLIFPPLLLFSVPYFYTKAVHKLKLILT